jgi:hypothetical protein
MKAIATARSAASQRMLQALPEDLSNNLVSLYHWLYSFGRIRFDNEGATIGQAVNARSYRHHE